MTASAAVDIQQNWCRYLPDKKKIGTTKEGEDILAPKNTLQNLFLALTKAPTLKGLFAFDEWRSSIRVARTPPWDTDSRKIPRPLCDTDYTALRVYLEGLDGFSCSYPKDVVADMIERTAKLCSFNDVTAYFSSLVWDRKPRIDTWLADYVSAENNEANRFMGSKYLISAIARALKPGTQVDHMLVLEGDQGIGKSTVFKVLFSPWYLEGMPDPSDPHAAFKIQGFLCVEASELAALSRGDQRAAKTFITMKEDVFRAPYSRNFVSAPRRCVFAATTNERDYLSDPTGARRFWCVRTSRSKSFRLDELQADRDQIWAEAKFRYEAGEHWWPETETDMAMLASVAAERMEDNVFLAGLQSWIALPMTTTPITINDALKALKIEPKYTTPSMRNQIVSALKSLGLERLSRRESVVADGKTIRVSLYDRKKAT